MEEVLAQVAPEAHRDFAAPVDRADRERNLDEREEQHDRAPRVDVVRVSGDDAFVDDAGVDRRQRQRGRRLYRLEDHDQPERAAVRTEVRFQESR